MSWHQKAGAGVHDLVLKIVEESYPDLHAAGVTFEVLFSYAPKGEDGQPKEGVTALKHGGYPAAALVRVMSQEQRAAGSADCRIKVDGDQWASWSERRQEAILAHEIHHVELKLDDEGQIQTDDCFRPKLKLKLHDVQLGVFLPIMKKYGPDAIDTENVKDAVAMLQTTMPWG